MQEEYEDLEVVTAKLAKDVRKVSEEIHALRKRQTNTIKSQRLLSMAKSAYNNIISGNKLKSQSAFIRSIQLIFAGPKESSLDLAAIRARKKSLSKCCNQICVLGANEITL
jgi:hypothetical protein